jgi:hypothetical protein
MRHCHLFWGRRFLNVGLVVVVTWGLAVGGLTSLPLAQAADEPLALPPRWQLEERVTDPSLKKIVLVAGSNFFKPGQHEYLGACAVLGDLLRQTTGVAPVLALDWPRQSETFSGARAVVFFLDGGEKHLLLNPEQREQVRQLAADRTGLVWFHQGVDVPVELGPTMRDLAGAAFEKGHSQRAHWVSGFETFPEHAITRGVTPFTIDDGWLYKLRFVPEMRGITPLMRTVSPKVAGADPMSDDAIVAWAFERPQGGRSFAFTGGHLHQSFAEAGYRRLLTNGILWSAGVEPPASGAPVALNPSDLDSYLTHKAK